MVSESFETISNTYRAASGGRRVPDAILVERAIAVDVVEEAVEDVAGTGLSVRHLCGGYATRNLSATDLQRMKEWKYSCGDVQKRKTKLPRRICDDAEVLSQVPFDGKERRVVVVWE